MDLVVCISTSVAALSRAAQFATFQLALCGPPEYTFIPTKYALALAGKKNFMKKYVLYFPCNCSQDFTKHLINNLQKSGGKQYDPVIL
jgi:hypothetical protein